MEKNNRRGGPHMHNGHHPGIGEARDGRRDRNNFMSLLPLPLLPLLVRRAG